MAKIKLKEKKTAGEEAEQPEGWHNFGKSIKWYEHFESHLAVSAKDEKRHTSWPGILTPLGYTLPKNKDLYLSKRYAPEALFLNILRLETIQMSISSNMDKYTALYSYHRKHHSENVSRPHPTEKVRTNNVKWKTPKKHILHHSICTTCKKRHNLSMLLKIRKTGQSFQRQWPEGGTEVLLGVLLPFCFLYWMRVLWMFSIFENSWSRKLNIFFSARTRFIKS